MLFTIEDISADVSLSSRYTVSQDFYETQPTQWVSMHFARTWARYIIAYL